MSKIGKLEVKRCGGAEYGTVGRRGGLPSVEEAFRQCRMNSHLDWVAWGNDEEGGLEAGSVLSQGSLPMLGAAFSHLSVSGGPRKSASASDARLGARPLQEPRLFPPLGEQQDQQPSNPADFVQPPHLIYGAGKSDQSLAQSVVPTKTTRRPQLRSLEPAIGSSQHALHGSGAGKGGTRLTPSPSSRLFARSGFVSPMSHVSSSGSPSQIASEPASGFPPSLRRHPTVARVWSLYGATPSTRGRIIENFGPLGPGFTLTELPSMQNGWIPTYMQHCWGYYQSRDNYHAPSGQPDFGYVRFYVKNLDQAVTKSDIMRKLYYKCGIVVEPNQVRFPAQSKGHETKFAFGDVKDGEESRKIYSCLGDWLFGKAMMVARAKVSWRDIN